MTFTEEMNKTLAKIFEIREYSKEELKLWAEVINEGYFNGLKDGIENIEDAREAVADWQKERGKDGK